MAPAAGSSVELRSSKRVYPQVISGISGSQGDVIVSFSGSRSISEALTLVGCSLWAEVPEPKTKSEADVLGFRVFDRAGACWGTVASCPRFSQNQLLEVRDAEGETVYVPWHESVIVKVDRRSRSLVIDPPAGLRDLNK